MHETNLHNLQTAHRSAADECLMLRYKNSLLERILLEKGMLISRESSCNHLIAAVGIDVQAELRAKTGSPHLGPTHMPQNMAQAPTVQRAIMNRHNQARRSNSNIAPKLEPGVIQSPQSRPTPPSHASSPTSHSPGFHNPGVITPPASEPQIQHQHPHQHQHQPHQQQPQPPRIRTTKLQIPHGLPSAGLVNTGMIGTPLGPKGRGTSGTGSTAGTPVNATFYPSPFQNHQNHYEQLGKLSRPLPFPFLLWNHVRPRLILCI